MNENIDLTKILEGCPKGTIFYSSVYGEVRLIDIDDSSERPIEIIDDRHKGLRLFTKEGRAYFGCGECTLFPSKDQRDWSKFVRFWDKPKVEKFDPKTLQPFDKVLVRYGQRDMWWIEYFGFVDNEAALPVNCLCNPYEKCIPYNDETKHLLGTTQDCPEYYKWWED